MENLGEREKIVNKTLNEDEVIKNSPTGTNGELIIKEFMGKDLKEDKDETPIRK